MKKPIDCATRYKSRLDHLRSCCTRVNELHGHGYLSVSDCDLLYESTFLNSIALFEGLLDELLTEFMCGKRSRKRGHYALMSTTSMKNYRTIVLQGRKYVECLPYKDFLDTVKLYLNEGKPFTEIDNADRGILAQAVLVRNAIAHRSGHALSRFRDDVAGVAGLPPHRRFPGPLLRKQYRAFPTQQWHELYFDTFEKVAFRLARNW